MFQLRWLWKNMEGSKGRYVVAMLLTIIASVTAVINPWIVEALVDRCITGIEVNGVLVRQMELFIPLLAAMVSVQVIRMVMYYVSIILIEKSSQLMLVKIREKLFSNVLGEEMRFFHRYRTGDLMTRFTGDLDMCRYSVAYIFRNLVNQILVFAAAFTYLMIMNWKMTLIVTALMPLILVVRTVFSRKVRPMFTELREKLSVLNTTAQENIEGNRVVRAFAREDYERKKFAEKNEDYRQANLRVSYAWLNCWPVLEFISQTLSILVILVGGLFVISGQMSPGQLLGFIALSWALSDPMRMLGMLFNDIERFVASANKVIELYYSRPTIVNRPDAREADSIKGDIHFRNVSFTYDREPVLQNINLEINAGETVAIMGATGTGKTTLVNLLARFYDVQEGSILIDGVDIRNYRLEDLRRGIGMATQDVFLFSDTVEGNIAYGDLDMPEEDVHAFAKMADADSFIQKMPEGYDTIVGERGVGLSGGQRQRIALARALSVRPGILILDDTTSAVDMETENYIQEQLRNLDFTCTKLIVAQRISSVKDADKIVVLGDNTIAQMGTHEELLHQEGYYREIYMMQNEGV